MCVCLFVCLICVFVHFFEFRLMIGSLCVCVSQESVQQFNEFSRLVEAKAVASMKEDITYGDIPDRFRGQGPLQ